MLDYFYKLCFCPHCSFFFLPSFDDERKFAARLFTLEILNCPIYISAPEFFLHFRHLTRNTDATIAKHGEQVFKRVNEAVWGFEEDQSVG